MKQTTLEIVALILVSLVSPNMVRAETVPITDAPGIIELRHLEPLQALPAFQKPELGEVQLKAADVAQKASDNLYEPGQCTWFVKNMRPDIPNSWGNATTWFERAQAQGWPTGGAPKVGAVAWRYGHVMYVVAVSGDQVTIRDMNGHYIPYEIGQNTVPSSTLRYIY